MNPTKETETNRKGIVYVVARMNWYWNLSSLLLKENTVDGGSSAGLRDELERRVVDLYKALLLYQMKSVCSYYRNRGLRFVRSLIQLDGWDGDLKNVYDAENAVQQDSKSFNDQLITSHLEKLVNVAKNQEMELRRALQEQLLAQMSEKDQQCLQHLRLTDPRHDMERIEQTKGGLLEGSYKWVLDHPDFQRWRNDKQSRLLWIKGGAGKGKTMLLIGIINELSKLTSTSVAGLLSFFLCQNTDAQLNNATAVLRGLIYVLIIQQSFLISHVQAEYGRASQRLFEGDNAFYALSIIFQNMLRDSRLTEAYLIVDALDECETGLPQLLDLITQTAQAPSTRVKWILSSRDRPDIEQQLTLVDAGVRLSLEVNAELVSQAIDKYIDYKVSQLTSIRNDNVLQSEVRKQLREKADGTFLWVALVFEELRNFFLAGDVLRILKGVPRGLQPLYDRMMEQIGKLEWYAESCRRVLSITILAYRPLHLLELRILAGLQDNISNMADLERIINLCGSFLTIREDQIYLIHQSAKDYLTTDASTAIFPAGPGHIHYDMFSRSLSALSQNLQKDIYNLEHPGLLADEVKPPDQDPLAPVRYSCVFWVNHLCVVDGQSSNSKNELSDDGAVFAFLKKHFLHWLESLSLLRKLSDGVSSIRELLKTIQVC